jgi:hypothetical protein
MQFGDPFESWLFGWRCGWKERDGKTAAKRLKSNLDRLSTILASPKDKKNLSYYQIWALVASPAHSALPEDVVDRIEKLCRGVIQRGGQGSRLIQEELLNIIGVSSWPRSIPFWSEILDFKQPRDAFAGQRRTFALAALAMIVVTRNDPSALNVLLGATKHPLADMRALAAHYLGRLLTETELGIPKEVKSILEDLYLKDSHFEPRFMAWRALASLGLPLPTVYPGGVLGFKVKHKLDKSAYHVIELSPESTMDNLRGHLSMLPASHCPDLQPASECAQLFGGR